MLQLPLVEHREASRQRARTTFVPSEPIREEERLLGRELPLKRTLETLRTPGRSVFVFGERGVGKTSLAQTAAHLFNSSSAEPVFIAGHPDLTFGRLLAQVAKRLYRLPVFAAVSKKSTLKATISSGVLQLLSKLETEDNPFPSELDINDAVDILAALTSTWPDNYQSVVVVDELDTIKSPVVKRDLAFLLKQLGDREARVKFMLVGIAENAEELLQHHESASRYMATIKLERLAIDVLRDVVVRGFANLDMSIPEPVALRIACISDGFAHFTHLISLKTALRQIDTMSQNTVVEIGSYELGLRDAVEDSESWLKSAYDLAVQKYRDKYEPVLWAAADHWELERSTEQMAASYERICRDLRCEALTRPNYSKALNNLKSSAHGPALLSSRRSWYRFKQSMVRGYCRMLANSRAVNVGLDYLSNRTPAR